MQLSREEVEHIALLARVGMTPEELEVYREELSNILENFEVLRRVDTQDVVPTSNPVAIDNVLREDTPETSLPQNDVLSNAPHEEDSLFRVRAILEE